MGHSIVKVSPREREPAKHLEWSVRLEENQETIAEAKKKKAFQEIRSCEQSSVTERLLRTKKMTI